MKEFNQEEFTLTSGDLAKTNGVSINCINTWRDKGAFPHSIVESPGSRSRRLFHRSCNTYTLGVIKENMAEERYSEPLFEIAKKERPISLNQKSVTQLAEKCDQILNHLERIEKALGL